MASSKYNDKYRKRRRNPLLKWLLGIVALAIISFVLSFGPASRLEKQHQQAIRRIPQKVFVKMVEVRDLDHEHLMHKTIKDCLPSVNKKCKTFVPESLQQDTEKRQRVALIVPPGKIASALQNHMSILADEYNHENQNTNHEHHKIDIIETTHVPPYGYGKSHGLTRIVKLKPQPILLQVTDALNALLSPTQNAETITFEDLQVGLLQIMRFHCRLSHVAAHTASLTIDAETLLNTTKLGLTLRDFITPEKALGTTLGEDTAVAADDDEMRVMFDQQSSAATILTRLAEQAGGGEALWKKLDDVLQEEMKRTKDMSVWPCPSFWEAPPPLQLSDLTKQLAWALSPDCDDPYVSCFVQKDKCEAAGNPSCKK